MASQKCKTCLSAYVREADSEKATFGTCKIKTINCDKYDEKSNCIECISSH